MIFANIKKTLMLACGVALLVPVFQSCHLDDPEPIPAEELYLRAFIKKYGLIDPNQDWNQAQKMNITVDMGAEFASEVTVFIECAGMYYRVAYFTEVEGAVTIPFDCPDGTDKIYVDIDGKIYSTPPGGTVKYSSRRASRTIADDAPYVDLGHQSYWFTFPAVGEDAQNMLFGNGSNYGFPDVAGHNVHLVSTSESGYSTITNTVQDAEAYMTLHTQSDEASAYKITFDVTGASSEADVDIVICNIGSSGSWVTYLNKTVSISPGNSSVEVLTTRIPANQWMNFYMGIRDIKSAGGNAGTFSNFKVARVADTELADLAWLLVAEDLGATDDFDFNDVIIRIQSTTLNESALKLQNEFWQVIKDDNTHMVLGAPSRPSGSRARNYTRLRITSLCAGGILDSYLHFSTAEGDFILRPSEGQDYTMSSDKYVSREDSEWHTWFGHPMSAADKLNKNNHMMYNTGANDATIKSAVIIVPDGFSMTNYSQVYEDYDGSVNNPLYPADALDQGAYAAYSGHKIHGFYITVGEPTIEKARTVLVAPKPGAAPQMFLIPDVGWRGYWHWPHERVSITDVYPRFEDWVHDATTSMNWYQDTPPARAITHEGYEEDAYFTRTSGMPGVKN